MLEHKITSYIKQRGEGEPGDEANPNFQLLPRRVCVCV